MSPPDIDRQFRDEPLRLTPEERQAAEIASARWNAFLEGKSRGRRQGWRDCEELYRRFENAASPGLFCAAFGYGAVMAAVLPHAGLLGGLAVMAVGVLWAWLAVRRIADD